MSVVLITGAGTGIGRLAARTVAADGHTVYATMRDPESRNEDRAGDLLTFAAQENLDLRVVELDVLSEPSARAAVERIQAEQGRLDVVVHNAAHLLFGITEAFTPEQVLAAYDTNTVGALRVNRAALPVMRRQRSGLLLWVGSGTSRVVPPFLAPYTAAKAAMDSFADSVAIEVARFGIETSIVMPGPFTQGTAHFPDAGFPADTEVASAYDAEYGAALAGNEAATESLFAPGVQQDVQAVADEIARVVGLPAGSRPYRSSVDFSDFGDVPVTAVATVQRERLLRRMRLEDTLRPTAH
ncbi:SDR family oxidoreductase [Modestobacter versicolor]|uniref:NAD(P)-dependent dehydrogenase (Short-subunit alcohol dehydrogenase family) n=1 Tax=Modestobacter versicolor TaxID=429133 RepID=A0A323VTG8_9ACTN|nr:SDR family oxidoreductase [Modestobacter versicolor]MBB3675952.1 NAD(P)-dependent dehydrogenase (short-subunit alcohol dehydrogenase family) [Modestobacter versicolor]PZA22258.1 oxidoreductase [Modestobacter versicolor]